MHHPPARIEISDAFSAVEWQREHPSVASSLLQSRMAGHPAPCRTKAAASRRLEGRRRSATIVQDDQDDCLADFTWHTKITRDQVKLNLRIVGQSCKQTSEHAANGPFDGCEISHTIVVSKLAHYMDLFQVLGATQKRHDVRKDASVLETGVAEVNRK